MGFKDCSIAVAHAYYCDYNVLHSGCITELNFILIKVTSMEAVPLYVSTYPI